MPRLRRVILDDWGRRSVGGDLLLNIPLFYGQTRRPRVSALLVLFLNRRFCGSDPIENVVYSFVQDAGRVNMGDKVLLQL